MEADNILQVNDSGYRRSEQPAKLATHSLQLMGGAREVVTPGTVFKRRRARELVPLAYANRSAATLRAGRFRGMKTSDRHESSIGKDGGQREVEGQRQSAPSLTRSDNLCACVLQWQER